MRWFGLVVLAALAAAVALSVALHGGLTVIDQPVLDYAVAHRSVDRTAFFRTVTTFGDTLAATVVVLAVAGLALLRRWWTLAVRALLAGVGAVVLVVTLKAAFGRQRPPVALRLSVVQNLSFPSGHALGSMMAASLLAAVAFVVIDSPWWRAPVVLVLAGYVLVIGVSRLYLGVHWATDVLGGWLLGATWTLLVFTLRPAPRPTRRRAPAELS